MSDANPFLHLVALAERSARIDVELPSKKDAQTRWNGLGFSLLGQRFVAPMQEVGELLRVPATTKLPGVKGFVVGVSNVRGRLLVVFDVAVLIGTSSTLPRAQRRILAVEEEEQYFGFMIDESLGMQHFPSEAFNETVADVDDRFRPFLSGCYAVGGTVWPVFSLFKLAKHPALEKLAAVAA